MLPRLIVVVFKCKLDWTGIYVAEIEFRLLNMLGGLPIS